MSGAEGFAAPVTILRDAFGIPHIRAEGGAADAFRAQGWAHAEDRLFQMELNRRRALDRAIPRRGPARGGG